jgi:predicted MFS family arabinose efflux permease
MTTPTALPTTGRAHQIATRLAFLLLGLAAGAWAPLVPFAKERLGAGDALLGLLLLCIGIGSLLTMPLTGAVIARFGCKRVIVVASIVLAASIPPLVLASSPLTLALALAVYGAALGANDVAMNVQAVQVEKDATRPLMSGFHGMWSAGGIAGPAIVTGALWLSGSPLLATLAVSAVLALLLAIAAPALIPFASRDGGGHAFVRPRGFVIWIGILCGIIFLTEGVVLDWSALFLRERGMDPATAGLGFAAFSAAMTICRLLGDRVVARLGGPRILFFGGLLVAVGYVGAVVSPWTWGVIPALVIIGIGASNVVPVLFTAAGRQTVMPQGQAIAAVTTIAYAGILLGPALVGFVAQATSLGTAFLGIAALMIFVSGSARLFR